MRRAANRARAHAEATRQDDATTSFDLPFDAVLPTSVRVDTTERCGAGIGQWRWLIATQRSLPLERLRAAEIDVEVADCRVPAGMRFLNPSLWAPLRPREVAGPLSASSRRAAVYGSLLRDGERFKDGLLEAWGLSLDFPRGLRTKTMLRCELRLGGRRVRVTTRLDLGDHESRVELITAVRLTAEVSPAANAASACAPLASPPSRGHAWRPCDFGGGGGVQWIEGSRGAWRS